MKFTLRMSCQSGGVTQVVQHLPSKCEVLSSSPTTAKKKKKERKKGMSCHLTGFPQTRDCIGTWSSDGFSDSYRWVVR
jgi:hypothetical protein